jgi:uncharacterized protein with HEPN domain
MYDRNLLIEKLKQIDEALDRVHRRSEGIDSPDAFLDTPEGIDKLDAICMMLIAVGESFKKIDIETDGKLLSCYSEIDWKGVKGIRDVLSHNYFNIDAEEIFFICKHNLAPLQQIVKSMLSKLSK